MNYGVNIIHFVFFPFPILRKGSERHASAFEVQTEPVAHKLILIRQAGNDGGFPRFGKQGVPAYAVPCLVATVEESAVIFQPGKLLRTFHMNRLTGEPFVAFGKQRRHLFVHSRIFAQQRAFQPVAHFGRALMAAEDVDELLLPVVGQVAEVALHVSVVAYCVGVDGCHIHALVARHYCEEHLFVNHVGADVGKTEPVAVEVVIPEKAEYLIENNGYKDDDVITAIVKLPGNALIDTFLAGSKYGSVAEYAASPEGQAQAAKIAANLILGEIFRSMGTEEEKEAFELKFDVEAFTELVALRAQNKINAAIQKRVLQEMLSKGGKPSDYLTADDLAGVDDSAVEGLCRDAIAANERAVRDYLGGKEQALKALLGFVMKATRGKANSGAVELKLKELLGK